MRYGFFSTDNKNNSDYPNLTEGQFRKQIEGKSLHEGGKAKGIINQIWALSNMLLDSNSYMMDCRGSSG